jgi:hypothetical protein
MGQVKYFFSLHHRHQRQSYSGPLPLPALVLTSCREQPIWSRYLIHVICSQKMHRNRVSSEYFSFRIRTCSFESVTRLSYRLSILGTDLFTCNTIARPMARFLLALCACLLRNIPYLHYFPFASVNMSRAVQVDHHFISYYCPPCPSFIRTFTHISSQIIKNNHPQRCLLPSSIPQAPP